jgi:hypothetical protein
VHRRLLQGRLRIRNTAPRGQRAGASRMNLFTRFSGQRERKEA